MANVSVSINLAGYSPQMVKELYEGGVITLEELREEAATRFGSELRLYLLELDRGEPTKVVEGIWT